MWTHFKEYINQEQHQQKVSFMLRALLFFGCIVYILIAAYHLLPEKPLFFATSDAIEIFMALCCGYLIYHKIIPITSIFLKTVGFVMIIVVISTLACLKMFRQNRSSFDKFSESFFEYIGIIFLFTALFYMFSNLNLIINNTHIKNKEALAVAQQQLLRQQLNPHFLFNAFNSLYSLSLQQSEKTPETILKLSSMMRYITDDTQNLLVPLKTELTFIEDYIAIEKVRFGKNASIQYSFVPPKKPIFIPPLLLITLVENAFKHGFYTNQSAAFVTINGHCTENELVFKVANSVFEAQHFNETNRTGKGLKNLKKRLDFHFPNNYQLDLMYEEDKYTALLKIRLPDA